MLPDQIIQMLVQDNVDVACAAIEKAAMDRAVADVDEGLATAYEARRRHREVSCTLMCSRAFLLTLLCSNAPVNRSGTRLHLSPPLSRPFLILCVSRLLVCNPISFGFMRISVLFSLNFW